MSDHIVKRGVLVVVLSIILSILGSGIVHAFGVSAPYLENDTLIVYPGHTYVYDITLQNGDSKNYTAEITYLSTRDVVDVNEKKVFVTERNYSIKVPFNITIPSDAKIGDIYVLVYNVTPKFFENSTEITAFNIPRGLNMLVVESPKEDIQQSNSINGMSGYFSSEGFKNTYKNVGKYLLILIVLAGIIFVALRIWKMSKKMSSKIDAEKHQNMTISDAKDIEQVREILRKISDEEFSIPEIREIFRKKIIELTKDESILDDTITRKELIKKIK